jgi:hypothetical protein
VHDPLGVLEREAPPGPMESDAATFRKAHESAHPTAELDVDRAVGQQSSASMARRPRSGDPAPPRPDFAPGFGGAVSD